jgi:flagellar hook protein FlgE
MIQAASFALEGMNRAETRLEGVAKRLASLGASSDPAAAVDTVDVAAEMVGLIEARNNFEVNTKVVHTSDEMTKRLLDVLG